MKDTTALSYVNLYALLGSLVQLCELLPEASALAGEKRTAVGFDVKGGPSATLVFENGRCTLREGVEKCDIRLPFSSPEKFNGLIDGTTTPIPSRGFTRISFLLGPFQRMTDLLTEYLRPTEERLSDPEFFRISTTLMLHLIASAIAQLGNEDPVARASASYIPDGVAHLRIGEELAVAVVCKDHRLHAVHTDLPPATAVMQFSDIPLARALFDGKVNAVAAVGMGQVRISGMIPMIDNINRILDRVALYLA